MRNSVSGIFLCTALIAVACSNPTAPSPAPASAAHTAALLEGTWTLTYVQPAGQARLDRPTTATYTLTFTDGRISARADCNMCGGTFEVAGTTINVGPSLACTRAACATASFETLYTSILGGASEISLNGSTLTLTSARGTVQFTRV